MLPSRFLRPGEVLEFDMQDMGVKSDAGNKALLVAVDKASKFLFAFPLPTKVAIGVSRKLLEVMLPLALPLYVRSDPGSEFTAEVMQHLCTWLHVTIAYGPADHPRAQGTAERLGGWLHEALRELCKTWPRRWDKYVQPALWIHRTTPDLRLPGKPTPFRLFFGRDAHTQLDPRHPEIDGGSEAGCTVTWPKNVKRTRGYGMYGCLYRKDMKTDRKEVRVRMLKSVGPRWEPVLLLEIR